MENSKEQFERFISDDETRKYILELYKKVIEVSHTVVPNNWNVCNRKGENRFQLNCGNKYVLAASLKSLLVMCNREDVLSLNEGFVNELLTKAIFYTNDLKLKQGDFQYPRNFVELKEFPKEALWHNTFQFKIEYKDILALLPSLEKSILHFAEWTTLDKPLLPASKTGHSIDFIDYLNIELGTNIPQPVYNGQNNISCIMANIAWNDNEWKQPSDNKTNFRWTQEEGNIAQESWNFDFDNPRNNENEILGYTQFTYPPKNAETDKFLIIFRSLNKIVGFYGNTEIKKVPLKIKDNESINLLGDKKLSLLLENKIDDSNHNFLFGKQKIGQVGFNKIDKKDAAEILDEALKLNPNQIEILNKLKEWITQGDPTMTQKNTLVEKNTDLLKNSKNLILTGAPGTGKTYLARQIAQTMGCSPQEIGFVQFHPSYDYTDFVEGLRPVQDESGSGQIGFERKDGVFKEFCARALKNLQDSRKNVDVLRHEKTIKEIVEDFLNDAVDKKTQFETITKNVFYVDSFTDRKVLVSIPQNEKVKTLPISLDDILELMSNNVQLNIGKDVSEYFNRKWRTQQDSYIYVLTKQLQETVRKNKNNAASTIEKVQAKNFVFIIDEINRGEVSKIFGELFYSVDPGYRVSAQELEAVRANEKQLATIKTQYANLETDGNDFDRALNSADYGHFFIPENVFIIGTMNDIDRSVESMDFAFRRRFTWVEVKAKDTQDMLDEKLDEKGQVRGLPDGLAQEAKVRMNRLNKAIDETSGLNEAYHIGASYFLKLNEYDGDFDKLWDYHLKSLLHEYLRGSGNEASGMESLQKAYFGEGERFGAKGELTDNGQ